MTRPTVLYHYTDASAFAKIVEHSQLWATDVRYLNDPDELKYAWDKFLSTLAERSTEATEFSDAYHAQLEAIKVAKAEDVDTIEDRVFATSLSAHRDDLNQWIKYAADGSGMALGFDLENIRFIKVPYYYHTPSGGLLEVPYENSDETLHGAALLQEVRYGETAREAAIADALWRVEQICGPNADGNTAIKIGNSIFRIPEHLFNLAAIKTDTYESEQEWRLTIPEHFGSFSGSAMAALSKTQGFEPFGRGPLTTLDVKFRDGDPAGLRPYAIIPFQKPALVEVILGPTVDADRGTSAARRLLDRFGFRDTKVVPSKRHYR